MNDKELRKLAIKNLNKPKINKLKKSVCSMFSNKKVKKDCITNFNNSFIKSFIAAAKKNK